MASNDINANGNSLTPQTTTETASKCPVLSRGGNAEHSAKAGLWNRWFPRPNTRPDSVDPQPNPNNVASSTESWQCPAKGKKTTPPSLEEAANYSQTPAPGQQIPLSTQRVISSIPRSDAAPDDEVPSSSATSAPSHQPANPPRWQYPSEQQFYNAMLRKGYNPPEEAIPDTLRIHNAVNERSWREVQRWEKAVHGNNKPRLSRFVGRPNDLSPRAWWNSRVLMTKEPFDRHDWYVEDTAGGGEPRRYVIDFYEGRESASLEPFSAEGHMGGVAAVTRDGNATTKPPSMYIDVRPALDNPSAALDRMEMFAREALPGIASVWDSYRASSAPHVDSHFARAGNVAGKEEIEKK